MGRELNEVKKGDVVTFAYTNWKGIRESRKAVTKGFFWGTSPYHTGDQLFMRGLDLDKMTYRDYAACDIESLVVVESIIDWEYND